MKDTSRMLISTIIAAALFLLMFLLLKWNLIFCILLCIGVYFGLFLLLKPNQKIAGISIEFIPEEEEIRKLLEDAQADFIEIDSAIKSISDSSVKVDAQTLYDTGKRILLYLKENPTKINLARRFVTYYLDTAAKLLRRYVDLQNTKLHAEKVTTILQKTAEALPVLNSAFEKQFTHLMEGELLDVEVDIELLKNALEMED